MRGCLTGLCFGALLGCGPSGQSLGAQGSGGAGSGEVCLGGECGARTQVHAGSSHTCATTAAGAVRCWGSSAWGLGYGDENDIGDDEAPASAGDVDVGGRVAQLAVGGHHTCALLEGGTVRCWGLGLRGSLGYANAIDIGDDEAPASAGDVDVGGRVVQIAAGSTRTCALLDDGALRCWGAIRRQIDGNWEVIGDDETPASVGDVDVGGKVVEVAVGVDHICALLDGGAVRCWGDASQGQLGYGNKNDIGDDETPASAGDVDVGGEVVQIAAGHSNTCAVLLGGGLRCWGFAGRTGYGTTDNVGDDETPASVGDVDVGGKVLQVSVGLDHACVLLETGAVRCWGLSAALGYGDTTNRMLPGGDVRIGGPVVQITAGYRHTCAVLERGAVRCWGVGDDGRLGYGNTDMIGDDEDPASAGDVPYL